MEATAVVQECVHDLLHLLEQAQAATPVVSARLAEQLRCVAAEAEAAADDPASDAVVCADARELVVAARIAAEHLDTGTWARERLAA